MSISCSLVFHYCPTIPCCSLFRFPFEKASLTGGNLPLQSREFCLPDGILPTVFIKETFGAPKFPSYPFEHMPWSQTPVVSSKLAMALEGLLPSRKFSLSAFHPISGGYPNVHNYTYFGAQYKACTLDSLSFGLPFRG